MTASYPHRRVLRALAVALMFVVAHAATAVAQSPNGVRCADGFVAATVAICNSTHQGVLKADTQLSGQTPATTQVSGLQGGLQKDGGVIDYRPGSSAINHPIRPPAPNPGGTPVPTQRGTVKFQWPSGAATGDSSSKAPAAISLPPGVALPDSQTQKQQKGKTP